MNVLIAGDGVGGLTIALSLHAVGIEAEVFEQAPEIGEAGVGISMLPRFVNELAASALESGPSWSVRLSERSPNQPWRAALRSGPDRRRI